MAKYHLNKLTSVDGDKKTAGIIFAILLVLSMACSIPGIWPPATPTPTQTATVENPLPTLALPPPPVPASLIESQPPDGGMLASQDPIILYFNQEMDRPSTENAIKVQPNMNGRFEWMNPTTVRFNPAEPIPPASTLKITIGLEAKAANGQAMTTPLELAFHTPGPLQAVDRLPKPGLAEADPSSAIVVTFNQPVVALGSDSGSTPVAFSLDPTATGRGQWLNTSTYIFYPDPPLEGGRNYRVSLNQDLRSTFGSRLESSATSTGDWSFSTANPRLVRFDPKEDRRIFLDEKIVLGFNQPMDTDSFASQFKMMDENSQIVGGSFSWNEQATEVTFSPEGLLARDSKYRVHLSGSASASGGTALGADFDVTYVTVKKFDLESTKPAKGQPLSVYQTGYTSITLDFTSPLAKQKIADVVKVNPEVSNLSISSSLKGSSVLISGYFKPETDYQVVLSSELHDFWGQNLPQPVSLNYRTTSVQPSLNVPMLQASSILYLYSSDARITAQATNIRSANLTLGKLDQGEFFRLISAPYDERNNYSPVDRRDWSQKFALEKNRNVFVDIPIGEGSTSLVPGLYYFRIQSPDITREQRFDSVLMVASRLNMLMKFSAGRMMVWVVDLENNISRSGARVEILNASGMKIGDGIADDQGMAVIDLPDETSGYENYYAVSGQPGETDFGMAALSWNRGVAGWDFSIPVVSESTGPHAYLYTERPIYRPGQTVNFKGILRQKDNARYSPVDMASANVTIRSDYSPLTGTAAVISSQTLPLSEFGTIHGSVNLPEDSTPGSYSIQVEGIQNSQISFQVADYRKPEIELNVKFNASDWLAGQDLEAAAEARYYFGAPAGNLKLTWGLYARRNYLDFLGGESVGRADTSWLSIYPNFGSGWGLGSLLVEGTAETNPEGKANIKIPAADYLEKMQLDNPQNLVLEVTAQDESQLPVSGRDSSRYHPSKFYIGIQPDSWMAQVESETSFTIHTVNWEMEPSGNHALKAVFQKVVWKEKEGESNRFGEPAYEPVYTPVASTDFLTDAEGAARIAFMPPDPGTYRVEVTGEGAVSEHILWVGGKGTAVWPTLPNQHIRILSDKGEYQSGETAKLFTTNPFEGKTLALLTVERNRVMSSRVIEIEGNSLEFQLPIDDDFAPNVYLSILLLGRNAAGLPDFRMGYLPVQVKPDKLMINLEMKTVPAQSRTGEEVKYQVRATDMKGEPVRGEFSLGVVDKAVLALADPNTPGLPKQLYGQQPNGVFNSLSLAAYGARMALMPAGLGGGGGDGIQAPYMRKDFRDTAYWLPVFETAEDGTAEGNFALPDNLTTWQTSVEGVALNSQVGEIKTEIVSTKELLIRPEPPRFLVVGDHLELAAIVHNNSNQNFPVQVSLKATGVTLDGTSPANQNILLNPGERKRINWWVNVDGSGEAGLVFSAEGGGYQDTTMPTWGKLPILTYQYPQTFATSGEMASAGERIEAISLPRDSQATGGELNVEMSTSLAGEILAGLKALEAYPYDDTEPILSRLMPNLETLDVLSKTGKITPDLKSTLNQAIQDNLVRLIRLQNIDGGWGWWAGGKSNPYISAYALLVLSRAMELSFPITKDGFAKAQAYLISTLVEPSGTTEPWVLDRQVFLRYALIRSGSNEVHLDQFYEFRDVLNTSARAELALGLAEVDGNDPHAKTLVSDLQTEALRTATGAHWQDSQRFPQNLNSPLFVSAVATLALAHLDPTVPILDEAVRYLVINRGASRTTRHEMAWILAAMAERLKGTKDLDAGFRFSAVVNGRVAAEGNASRDALNPIRTSLPLISGQPGTLQFLRDGTGGHLYYRAQLKVNQPIENSRPLQNGLMVSREYFRSDWDCRKVECKPVKTIGIGESNSLLFVRITLTVPEDMYYISVEDFIPSGTEIVNTHLNTSRLGSLNDGHPPIIPGNPFSSGWGWWFFASPRIFDNRIQWVSEYVPAGTYQLVYKLQMMHAGRFHSLPAVAQQVYFPEVEGTSGGNLLEIQP